MVQPLTIQIPEPVFECLQQRAKQLGKTPELVAAECVVTSMGTSDDPLMKWADAIDSKLGDVAERHDHYLGQALAEEVRGGVHE
jgi:hypothetical protein